MPHAQAPGEEETTEKTEKPDKRKKTNADVHDISTPTKENDETDKDVGNMWVTVEEASDPPKGTDRD